MVARVEDAVILADQFGSGVLTDSAKLVVHVGNRALNISDGDDRMLIEGKLLIGQLLQRNRAGAEAFSSIGLQHSHFGHRHFRKNSSSLGTLKDSNGDLCGLARVVGRVKCPIRNPEDRLRSTHRQLGRATSVVRQPCCARIIGYGR